jgi:flagellar hook-basal body complex protein FliE
LRSGYTVGSSLENTFNKIEDYRLKANKDQNRFLIEDEGIKLLEACNKLNKATLQER